MALTYKTLSLKKFLFIFLSCLLFQQLTAQTIVKFDNGNNIIYKNLPLLSNKIGQFDL